jgi:hypothetical protein
MITSLNPSNFLLTYLNRFFLQASIIEYFITFLPASLILFYTFYLLWAGRRKNHKIIRLSRDALLEVFSEEFDDLIIDQESLSSNGGLLSPEYKKSQTIPFKDFRVVFALEERHLMLSVIISWFAGVKDYIALEANAKKGKLPTKVQIIPKEEEGQIKKHQDLLFKLDDVELKVSKIDEFFVIKATSQRSGTYFLGEKNLLKLIYSVRNTLVRISIDSSDDPSIRIYAKINDQLDLEKLRTLFIALCERVDAVSEKVVMKRGRS